MRLEIKPKGDYVKLEIPKTDEGWKTIELPKRGIQYWYPFNSNFYYQYSTKKEFMYIVKDKKFKGENYYKADILKRSKPLKYSGEIPLNPKVYRRNREIIRNAKKLGIPTIDEMFDEEDVKNGFMLLKDLLDGLKEDIETRLLEESNELDELISDLGSDREKTIYDNLTEYESEDLVIIGEMYAMMGIMRKLAE